MKQEQLKSFFVPKTGGTQVQRVQKVLGMKVLSTKSSQQKPLQKKPQVQVLVGATITKCIARDDVLNAEVLWAVKTVMSHFSANSSSNTGDLFRKMFPDNQIAQVFNCRKNKMHLLLMDSLS